MMSPMGQSDIRGPLGVDAVEKGLDPIVVPLDADWAENSLSL
jgi:hypothetical protein